MSAEDADDVKEQEPFIHRSSSSGAKGASGHVAWRSEGYWSGSWAFIREHWVPMLANAFEWFEFATFAYLVDPISENFSNGSHVVVWFIFSIAFLCRPIGGVLIGALGDAMGRKPAFWVASITVVASTVLQGALPSYQTGGEKGGSVGLALLLMLRVTQGLGIGGELGSSVIYLTETSPRRFVGMTMGWLSVSSGLGFLGASFVAALLNSALTEEQIVLWGWRIPFLLALFPGIVVLYLLSTIQETPVFENQVVSNREEVEADGDEQEQRGDVERQPPARPARRDTLNAWDGFCRVAALFCMLSGAASFWYVGAVYVFDWVRERDHSIDNKHVLWIAVFQNTLSMPFSLLAGYGTDRWGLKQTFPWAMSACLLTGLPVYALLYMDASLAIMIIGPGIIFGFVSGVVGTTTSLLASDLFPPALRHRSVGLGYNLSICMFGGLGPAWVELAKGALPLAPGYFLALTASMSLAVYYLYGEAMLPKESLARSD